MHTYRIQPIDFGFENWETIGAALARLAALDAEMARKNMQSGKDPAEWGRFGAAALRRTYVGARSKASVYGCDLADLQQVPRVFWVPVETGNAPCFVFKTVSNGTTYVVSPVALPHLEALTV